MNKSPNRRLSGHVGLCAALGGLLCFAPAQANGLKQVNPVRQAPPLINAFGPDATMDHNEYPWFSSDGISGGFSEVIPPTTHPVDGSVANETEPFVSPDNKRLFWASNAWGGQGNIAHHIVSSTTCGMTTQSPSSYATLPSGTYPWKDQYTSGFSYQKTSRTNYHAILERGDGKTALVFEECQGQYVCNTAQTGNRACECSTQNDFLSTTGFTSGDTPSAIANWPVGPLEVSGGRVTHPAVSGPQNADGSWLLFFMRGKKIWYTKVREMP